MVSVDRRERNRALNADEAAMNGGRRRVDGVQSRASVEYFPKWDDASRSEVAVGKKRKSREPEIHVLTREQVLALIDERARYYLGISGDEFMRRYYAGELEDAAVEMSLACFADLVSQ